MGYVSVKGGYDAINNAKRLVEFYRIKSRITPVSIDQVKAQFRLALDRIMGEGSLYDADYAAVAFKQSEGDLLEAAFILRAYRATLTRKYYSEILDTAGMTVMRRISASFREIPGGQVLGPTRDYTQRTINPAVAMETFEDHERFIQNFTAVIDASILKEVRIFGKVVDLLKAQGLLKPLNDQRSTEVFDVTKNPVSFPAPRSASLQMLARAETSALMSMAYSGIRGYATNHPTVGELRIGYVAVKVKTAGNRVRYIGKIIVTEAEMVSKTSYTSKEPLPYFSCGYGLCFGQNETKAISMGILDRSLRSPEGNTPANDQEFVLYHSDGIEAMGFINHLKLPHYVTFQSSVNNLRLAMERATISSPENNMN